MEPDRAIEIVQSLSDGVGPYSGERFPSDSPYQQADTVRALHLALEGLGKLKRSTARKTGPGRPWTEDEEQELLRQFDDKIDVEEIAAKHENDLYAAMRWLYERQPQIEEKLARGHLEEGTTVLYDLSSTYYEWSHCSFAE